MKKETKANLGIGSFALGIFVVEAFSLSTPIELAILAPLTVIGIASLRSHMHSHD